MLLAGMLDATHTFVRKAAQMAAQEGATGPIALPAAVYSPFQSQLDRWAACCLCRTCNAMKEGACASCCTCQLQLSYTTATWLRHVPPHLSMVQRPDALMTLKSQHTLT